MTAVVPNAPPFTARLLSPRYWPTWLAIALVRLLCRLPVDALLRLGERLGWALGRLLKGRRHIVQVNLRLCFPELTEAARTHLIDAHFRALGSGVFETALAWFAADRRVHHRFAVEGREHLDALRASGQGFLLLTGHFTTLEMGGRLITSFLQLPVHAMYRPYDNEVLNYCMHRWRAARSRAAALPRDDLRQIVRVLRGGGAIWYGPDQTLDPRMSTFAPFFGVPTLTLTATSRLAQMGRAKVLPYLPLRENGRWIVRFLPPLDDFPSGDEQADAARVNRVIEAGVRRAPAQYFWVHRRFKKRPKGERKVY